MQFQYFGMLNSNSFFFSINVSFEIIFKFNNYSSENFNLFYELLFDIKSYYPT